MPIATRPLLLIAVLNGSFLVVRADQPEFLIQEHDQWRYHAAATKPATSWNQPGFDDQEWDIGQAGIGYGDGDDRTELVGMRGHFTSVYMRTTFEVDRPDDIASLYLYVNYDDGFIAYLNGKEVASASVERVEEEFRANLHEAIGYEEFVLKDASQYLVKGPNTSWHWLWRR